MNWNLSFCWVVSLARERPRLLLEEKLAFARNEQMTDVV